MSGKAFLGLLIAVILLGGGLGGAYIGGYTIGERKGKSQGEASAAEQASQQLQQLRQQFQSQFGQSGQGGQAQGTPQPGGQGRTGVPTGSGLMGGGQVGTIQKIENGKLTLDTARGPLEATLSKDTTVEMTTAGKVADLKPGMRVAVIGQRDDSGVVQARSVTIVPEGATSAFPFGGGGLTPTR